MTVDKTKHNSIVDELLIWQWKISEEFPRGFLWLHDHHPTHYITWTKIVPIKFCNSLNLWSLTEVTSFYCEGIIMLPITYWHN